MRRFAKISAGWLLGVFLSFNLGAAPASLTLADLRSHPERWPASITVPRDLQFRGGTSVRKGQIVKVADLEGNDVVVDDGKGLVFGLPIGETDFVQRANEAWSQLTPEQQSITADVLAADPTLWPLKVRSFGEFRLRNGTVIKPGGEYELLAVERDGVQMLAPEFNTTLKAGVQTTDLVERARALVSIPVEKRPSRMAAQLRGNLVDASGKSVDLPRLEETQVFALYYGASWCAPCRKFSPSLVKFIDEVSPANPRLTVVLMSNDKADSALFGYMREEKMPWVAMPLDRVMKAPALVAYTKGAIPQLVIVDRFGKVLADSYRGKTYLGPEVAMRELGKILETGVAK